MIRVVIDTNIIVSAILQPLGPPAQIFLRAVSGSIQLCITGEVYAEYALRSLSTLSPGFLGGVLDVTPRVALG